MTGIQRPKGDSHGTLGETVLPRRLTPQPLRSLRERQLALLVLAVGTLVLILDGAVVSVALPSIRQSLGFSQQDLAWVMNAYLIPFGGLLLFAGRLGDLVGRRRIFVGGLALFTVASIACALAQSPAALVVGRFVQGVGAALAASVVLGMIVTLFPKPREQAQAIGFYGFIAASGGAIGLLTGAVLTDLLSWHWIFLVNLPIGVVTIAFALRLLDDGREADDERRVDALGAALVVGSLMLWVYTIVQSVDHGLTSRRTAVLAATAALLLVAFVVWQTRARHPLFPLRLLKTRNVAWATVVQGLMEAGPPGMFFLCALYLQQVGGFSAIEIGLAFLPVAVAIAVTALKVMPRLMRHFDAKTVLIAGLVTQICGLALFTRIPVDSRYLVDTLPAMLLVGAGAGLGTPAVLRIALADATNSDAGVRSGLVNTTQQMGAALGLAVLATVSTSWTARALAQGQSLEAALTSGYRLGFVVGVGIALTALVVAVATLQTAVPQTAPPELDPTRVEAKARLDKVDLTGAVDADFLALGLGGTNMMAMLWSVAMGRRAVGVELRGDPFVSVMHWHVREDLYHHLALLDRMMRERYGEDRIPRRGDGSLFLLHECFYTPNAGAGDARSDEVISGWNPGAHIAGIVQSVELIDDRWVDGRPHRSVHTSGPADAPAGVDPSPIGRSMADVLAAPSTFLAGAEELLILLRRYLEAMERMDLAAGVEPRCRLFTYHRVVTEPDGSRLVARLLGKRWASRLGRSGGVTDGFVDASDGRKRIRIEAIHELDEKRGYRRMRRPGSEVIDLGTPEVFMVAEGLDSADARRLGFRQELVTYDHQDGRGPVVAQADFVFALMAVHVDSRCRRRIASEFDKEGNEYWVRQVGVGHEDDSEIGWFFLEVPDFKPFDPIRAGVVPPGTDRTSKKYFAGYAHLLMKYYLSQVALVTEIPLVDVVRTSVASAPRLFSVVAKRGVDARVAANGVVAGDSFGNGHFLTSGGVNTGMIGHGSRVLRYWQAREAGVAPETAIRQLADGIKEDTEGWLQVSEPDFRQPFRDGVRNSRSPGRRLDPAAHEAILEATRRHRRSIAPVDNRDEWSRLTLHLGRLHTFTLPPIPPSHPDSRPHPIPVRHTHADRTNKGYVYHATDTQARDAVQV